jgi:hypothetical protein
MPHLFRADTGQPLAEVSDEHLRQLIEALEEETSDDTEYFIDADTVQYMAEQGVDPSLLALLEAAVGDDGLDIRWTS